MAIYKVDPAHSNLSFKVKHLMILSVVGGFKKFDLVMESETEDFIDAKIKFECDVNSICTNIKDRDAHLKSADFFDVENWPTITFESTNIQKVEDHYLMTGDLTIKGITKEVQVKCTYNGSDVDHYNLNRHGFEIESLINRSDFDLAFNEVGGKGSNVIGQEVKIMANIQVLEAELV